MNAFAICRTVPVSAKTEFRIIPAGVFRSIDGRPKDIAGWVLDAAGAARISAQVAARANDILIDYEHASLQQTDNPVRAAGWFKKVEWHDGDGLYATDVRWTPLARAMIEEGEYRYISPVFTFNKNTGEVTALDSVGLTNRPALDGLMELSSLTLLRTALGHINACSRDPLHYRAREAFKAAFGFDLDEEIAHASSETAQLTRREADARAVASDPMLHRTRAMFRETFGMEFDAGARREG